MKSQVRSRAISFEAVQATHPEQRDHPISETMISNKAFGRRECVRGGDLPKPR